MDPSSRTLGLAACASLLVVVSSCANLAGNQRNRYTSNVVSYLYPDRDGVEVQAPSVPRLSLPLRVGVAFVPEKEQEGYFRKAHELSESDRLQLAKQISSEFEALPFVKEIEIIPSAYLTQGGGFTNLDQIQAMYGIDVIALISYDQVQHTDEDWLSLSYWTVVGAYVVEGEKNDTSTMVDAAVFDIKSRKLLFRAPGTSHVVGTATPINLPKQLRQDSLTGLQEASASLVENLHIQLELFQEKVKAMPEEYEVEHKPGYSGGGSIGGGFAMLLLSLGTFALMGDRNRRGLPFQA